MNIQKSQKLIEILRTSAEIFKFLSGFLTLGEILLYSLVKMLIFFFGAFDIGGGGLNLLRERNYRGGA